jgi:DNA-binding PadR family transcriptional regulator
MTSLFKFGSHDGKMRSLLALYILHSLQRNPASGYDLRKEIGEKTNGLWVPSKGTIYPVLLQLEEEDLIVLLSCEKRSRKVYGLTGKGAETLTTIRERGRESHKKMVLYKNLILDIFGGEKFTVKHLLFEIKTTVEAIPPGNEERVVALLEQCLVDLRSIS